MSRSENSERESEHVHVESISRMAVSVAICGWWERFGAYI